MDLLEEFGGYKLERIIQGPSAQVECHPYSRGWRDEFNLSRVLMKSRHNALHADPSSPASPLLFVNDHGELTELTTDRGQIEAISIYTLGVSAASDLPPSCAPLQQSASTSSRLVFACDGDHHLTAVRYSPASAVAPMETEGGVPPRGPAILFDEDLPPLPGTLIKKEGGYFVVDSIRQEDSIYVSMLGSATIEFTEPAVRVEAAPSPAPSPVSGTKPEADTTATAMAPPPASPVRLSVESNPVPPFISDMQETIKKQAEHPPAPKPAAQKMVFVREGEAPPTPEPKTFMPGETLPSATPVIGTPAPTPELGAATPAVRSVPSRQTTSTQFVVRVLRFQEADANRLLLVQDHIYRCAQPPSALFFLADETPAVALYCLSERPLKQVTSSVSVHVPSATPLPTPSPAPAPATDEDVVEMIARPAETAANPRPTPESGTDMSKGTGPSWLYQEPRVTEEGGTDEPEVEANLTISTVSFASHRAAPVRCKTIFANVLCTSGLSAPRAAPLIGLKADVHCAIYPVDAPAATFSGEPIGYIPAFSYVLESKRSKKFVQFTADRSFAVIAEFSRFLYLYKVVAPGQPSAPHQVLELLDESGADLEILGMQVLPDRRICVLTEKKAVVYQLP
ncbi:hypothetical protein PAPYR_4452 [Paratrimastix pyriformis]|uniref:CNH domain-containing protein n=1 Tax=Paratrimastix pyriformis TaxID=342808 RepID=A0ABQ8UPQ9_9EUKA|nr:hypothetical protein PAPYR_4452 [Paratrimastix pyriformis]